MEQNRYNPEVAKRLYDQASAIGTSKLSKDDFFGKLNEDGYAEKIYDRFKSKYGVSLLDAPDAKSLRDSLYSQPATTGGLSKEDEDVLKELDNKVETPTPKQRKTDFFGVNVPNIDDSLSVEIPQVAPVAPKVPDMELKMSEKQEGLPNPFHKPERMSDIVGESLSDRIQKQINILGESAVMDAARADALYTDVETKLAQMKNQYGDFINEYNRRSTKQASDDRLVYTEHWVPWGLGTKQSKEDRDWINANSAKYDRIQRDIRAIERQKELISTYKQLATVDRSIAQGEVLSSMVSDGDIQQETMDILRSGANQAIKDDHIRRMVADGQIDTDTANKISSMGDLTNNASMMQGLFKTGSVKDIATLGMNEISRNFDIVNIANKLQDGIPVTEDERNVFTLYSKLSQMQNKDRGFWFGFGQMMQQSLLFGVEAALTGGLGTAGKQLGKTGVKALIEEAGEQGMKKVLGKVAKNSLDVVKKSAIKQAKLTPLTFSTYANFSDRIAGQTMNAFNEGKELSFGDYAKQLYLSYAETFAERFSESFGNVIENVPMWTIISKGKATRELNNAFLRTLSRIADSKGYKATSTFLEDIGVQSAPVEMMSELSGTLTNYLLQIPVEGFDNEALNEITPEFFLQVGLQSLMMGGMGTLSKYTVGAMASAVEEKKAQNEFERALGKVKGIHFSTPVLNDFKEQLIEAMGNESYIPSDEGSASVASLLSEMNEIVASTNDAYDKFVLALADNAVRQGAYRYGQMQAIKSYVESKIGEFENEDGNVYEVTDPQGNAYYMLDSTDDAVILIDRNTGEKSVKRKDFFNEGSIKQTNGNDFALQTFILNIDKWNAENVQMGGNGELNVDQPQTQATHVQMYGQNIPIERYDEQTGAYYILDSEGNEVQIDPNDPGVSLVYEGAQELQNGQNTDDTTQVEGTGEQNDVDNTDTGSDIESQGDQTEQVEQMEYDEEGNPVWLSASAERGKQEIDSAFEGDEAKAFVADKVKEAEKALKKLENKKPKSTNIRDRKLEIEKIKADKEQAKANLEYWNSMNQLYNAPVEEIVDPVAEPVAIQKTTSDSVLPEGVQPYTVGENIKKRYEESPKVYGAEDTYTDADGNTYKGRWVVVEADGVTASHDPNTLQTSEGFPLTDKGRNVNDNDYSTKRGVVETMAANYDSRALDEPVIVSEGAIVSGNNRTISGQIAAQNGTDTKYKEALPAKSAMRGIPSEELSKFKNPRLVFELAEPIEYTTENFARFNRARNKTKSPVDMAIAIGKQDTSRLVGQILSTIGEVEKLSELYQNQNTVAAIMKQIVESGIINQNEMPQFYTQEYGITDAGKDFIETLLIGSVINEDQIRILNSEGMKQYREKIVSAMLPIANNMKYEDNIGKHLNTAIKYLKEARDAKTDLRGILLDIPLFDAKEYEDLSIFTALMLQRKPTEFREFINNLNQRLELGTDNLFGESNNAESVLEDYEQQNKLTDNERETIRLARQERESATQGVSGGVQTDGINTNTRGEGDNGDSISKAETAEQWLIDDIAEDEEGDVILEDVLNVFDEYQQKLDKINQDIQNVIEDAKKHKLPPLIDPALKEKKRKLLEDFISELTTDNFSVVTIHNADSVMKADGLTDDDIRRYINRAYYIGTGRAIFKNGKYYFFSENIKTIDDARRYFVHERQHRLTSENTSLIREVVSNSTREDLERIVREFSHTNSYDGLSHEGLADEFISFSMEEAYSTNGYERILKNKGVNDRLINIIKRIDDEQKNSSSLFNARRGTARNKDVSGVGQSSSGQNGRNKEKESTKVGEKGFGSPGRSGEGAWNISKHSDRLERTTEQKQALFDKAKEVFGTTTNFKVAGYMLPDGSLLDFSGRWEGGPGDARFTDHRAIGSGLYEASETDSNYETNMYDFINQGAIRLMPESGGIYVSQPLTDAQEEMLARYIARYNGEVILDITDKDGNIISYIEYNRRTSANRVLDDINNYFDKGVVPTQPEIRYRSAQPSFTDEENAIIEKAKENGTYLKATNGKDTKLTPKQWAQVRTKAFKNWFGDWENDPENASKVVDENGEPKVVYHGSVSEDIEAFDKNKINANETDAYYNGFWFSTDSETSPAWRTAKKVYPVFLNLRNPITRKQAHKIAREYFKDEEFYDSIGSEGIRSGADAVRAKLQQLGYDGVIDFAHPKINVQEFKETGQTTFETSGGTKYVIMQESDGVNVYEYDYYSDDHIGEFNTSVDTIEEFFNDAYFFGDETFVVFEPNQIKSAIENIGAFSKENDDIRYRSAQPFYSNAEMAVQGVKQDKATPEQWLAMLTKNGGLKAGEDRWLGLSDWLKEQKGSVTKQEILDYINANKIEIEEVNYSENPTGNERNIQSIRLDYTTKGLENKKEIALTIPNIEPYNERDKVHFGDAGNGRAVVWVRFGDFTEYNELSEEIFDALGKVSELNEKDYVVGLSDTEIQERDELRDKIDHFNRLYSGKVLVIDEIQSKRHQDAREKGYASKVNVRAEQVDGGRWHIYDGDTLVGVLGRWDASTPEEAVKEYKSVHYVQDAPFEKNWHELAMKRMLRYAAENGYARVAWTTGATQTERYNIGLSVREIMHGKFEDGRWLRLFLTRGGAASLNTDNDGVITEVTGIDGDVIGKNISDILGKDIAFSIMNNEGDHVFLRDGGSAKELSTPDLRVGGEGMKGFYDKMLVDFMNKYGKKWGVKVYTEMSILGEEMHFVEVTDAMVRSVMEGQPMFRVKSERQESIKSRQRAENIMKDAIAPMAAELGVEVNYVTNEDISDVEPGARKKRQSKGWYQDGKVYINLSTHETIDDARETYLHEVVGHYGLRGLLKDQFEPVMQKVFASLTPTQQKNLLEIFADEVEAAEEFLSSMAENDIDPTIVEKVIGFIREALRSMGINLDNYTDGDLQYLLWRSKNSLKENAGNIETARWEAKDAEVRYRTVGRPAGYSTNDLEMTAKDKFLHKIQDRMRPVTTLLREIEQRGGTMDEASDVHSQEFLSASRASAEMEDFNFNMLTPLVDSFAEAMKVFADNMGMVREDAEKAVYDYLYAKHAIERNKKICMDEMLDAAKKGIAPDKAKLMDADFIAELEKVAEQLYDNQFNGGTNIINPSPALTPEQNKLLIVLAGKMQKEADKISRHFETDASGKSVYIGNNRSGMNDTEAKALLTKLYTPDTKGALDDVSAKVKVCTDFTLDKWLEYGLISQAEYDEYKARYNNYIPLRGWEEKSDNTDYASILNSRKNSGGLLDLNREAKGRWSKADNPIAHIQSMAQSACITGNRNLIRQKAFNLVMQNENIMSDLATFEYTYEVYDDDGNLDYTTPIKPEQSLFDEGKVKTIRDKSYEWHKTSAEIDTHVVSVFINGDRHNFVFKGTLGGQVATAVKGNENKTTGIIKQLLAKGTRAISANLTARNVYFLGKNLMRDLGFGTFAYFVENGKFINPAVYAGAMKTAAMDAMHADPSSIKDYDLYQEFKLNGGQTGYVQLKDIDNLKKDFDKLLKEATANDGFVVRNGKEMWDILTTTFDVMGKASENAMRFAVYKMERQRGASPREAAIRAKEITVNFNRQGVDTKGWSATYAFFNPAVQGAYRYAKLAKEHPGRFVIATAALMAMKFGLGVICEMFSGGDDEPNGESAYDRLSDYVKATNWVIPLSWMPGEGNDDKFLCIPLPQSVRASTHLSDCAVDILFGRKDFGEAIKYASLFAAGEFLPFDIDAIDVEGKRFIPSLVQSAMPTIARPLYEAYVSNRDFMGNPISKEPFLRDQDYIPQSELAFGSTSPILVGTSKFLNKLAGGDDYRSAGLQITQNGQVVESALGNFMDVNPARLEHLFSGYFGGVFKPVVDTWTTMSSFVDEDVELTAQSAVLVNQFIKGPTSKPGYKTYYRMRDENDDIVNAVNIYKDKPEYSEDYKRLISNRYNHEVVEYYKTYSEIVKSLNESIALIKTNSANVEDYKEKIAELEAQRDALILEAATAYRDICKRRDNDNKLDNETNN